MHIEFVTGPDSSCIFMHITAVKLPVIQFVYMVQSKVFFSYLILSLLYICMWKLQWSASLEPAVRSPMSVIFPLRLTFRSEICL